MRHFSIFAASFAIIATSGATAQPVLTDVAKVVEAVEDCASSMNETTLDEELLRKRGWFTVDIQMSNNPMGELPTVYGKSENNPLVRIVGNPKDDTGCMVEGWFKPDADSAGLIPALTDKFGEPTSVAGLNVTDFTSGTTLEDGTSAFRSGDVIVIPLGEPMLGASDFRIIVTLPGVAK